MQIHFDQRETEVCGNLSVIASDSTATLQADGSTVLHAARGPLGWQGEGGVALPSLVQNEARMVVLMRHSLACTSFDDVRPRTLEHFDSGVILAQLSEALELLSVSASPYANWVARAVRTVLPLERPLNKQYLSGSYVDRPGAITCSFPAPALMLAELLVHEASHHHFYILSRLGALHDETDENSYYSPIRGLHRPLLYILLAYHAVANMVLFHRNATAGSTPHAAEHAARAQELGAWLPDLEAPIVRPGALTSLGTTLCAPLFERLNRS
jgi:HEXXH motif-containing protein